MSITGFYGSSQNIENTDTLGDQYDDLNTRVNQNTVNITLLETDVATAQTTADSAQADADSAQSDATSALSKANTALGRTTHISTFSSITTIKNAVNIQSTSFVPQAGNPPLMAPGEVLFWVEDNLYLGDMNVGTAIATLQTDVGALSTHDSQITTLENRMDAEEFKTSAITYIDIPPIPGITPAFQQFRIESLDIDLRGDVNVTGTLTAPVITQLNTNVSDISGRVNDISGRVNDLSGVVDGIIGEVDDISGIQQGILTTISSPIGKIQTGYYYNAMAGQGSGQPGEWVVNIPAPTSTANSGFIHADLHLDGTTYAGQNVGCLRFREPGRYRLSMSFTLATMDQNVATTAISWSFPIYDSGGSPDYSVLLPDFSNPDAPDTSSFSSATPSTWELGEFFITFKSQIVNSVPFPANIYGIHDAKYSCLQYTESTSNPKPITETYMHDTNFIRFFAEQLKLYNNKSADNVFTLDYEFSIGVNDPKDLYMELLARSGTDMFYINKLNHTYKLIRIN